MRCETFRCTHANSAQAEIRTARERCDWFSIQRPELKVGVQRESLALATNSGDDFSWCAHLRFPYLLLELSADGDPLLEGKLQAVEYAFPSVKLGISLGHQEGDHLEKEPFPVDEAA